MSRRILLTLPDAMAARLIERRGYLSDQEYILQLINRDLIEADRQATTHPPQTENQPEGMLTFD